MRCNKKGTTWFPGSGHVVVSQYFIYLYIFKGVPYNEQGGQHKNEEQVQGEMKMQENWLANHGRKGIDLSIFFCVWF